METTSGQPTRTRTFLRWLKWIALATVALLVVATGLAILNNNFSFSRPSRADIVSRLNHSLAASTDWTMGQFSPGNPGQWATKEGIYFVSNPPLAHMLVDCAEMADNTRLQQLSIVFKEAHRKRPILWAKLVDPAIVTYPPSDNELAEQESYMRWMLYGISPTTVHLSASELKNMFSPDKFRTGKATHQLLSLYIYRKFNGDTPELQRVMNQVEERIAAEAALDFRVTDLYLQRISFLLAAGRPDLVKPRWVERALSAQQSDGGWLYNWHGWAPQPYSYDFSYEQSATHTTAQGMWMGCMLKHRYAEWIDRNYK